MKSVHLTPVIAAWIILIFYLGTIPNSFPEPDGNVDYMQKLGHFAAHFVLAALIYLLVSKRPTDLATNVRAVLIAVVFTLGIGISLEAAQLFAPSRSPQVLDILFDGLGAIFGVSTIMALDIFKIERAHTYKATAGVAFTGIILFGFGTLITGSAAIPRFVDCNGILHPPARAASPTKVHTTDEGKRVSDGLIALYDFSEGSGTVVHDSSNVEPALDLRILDTQGIEWISGYNGVEFTDVGSAIQSMTAALKIYEFITVSGQLTVEAWVTPDNLTQEGPVRIVTMSDGTLDGQVNFHLGQSSTDASFRLRTTCHSTNKLIIPAVLNSTASPQHMVMAYDGVTPIMFTDGEAEPLRNLPAGYYKGTFSDWDADYPLMIGNETTLNRSYLGKVHLIAIYDRALSGVEVKHNFDIGLGDGG